MKHYLLSIPGMGLLVLVLATCSPGTALAQTPPQQTAQQTPPPQTQAQQPEPQAAPVDPAEAGGDEPDPIRVGPITLSGSAWAETVSIIRNDNGEPADMFRIRRARIGIAGNIAPRIGWNLSGELTAEPMLRNAFLLFRFADQFNVRVGQATPPTALERGIGALQLELIERSRVTSQLTSGADQGFTVMNAQPFRGWVSYAASVINGVGFNQADNNNAKDVAGRIAITPPAIGGLAIVVSGSTGKQPSGRRTRSGLGVEYDVRSFRILMEGLKQSLQGSAPSNGTTTMFVYRFHPATVTPHFRMLELAARYVTFHDPDSATRPPHPEEEGGGQAPAPTGFVPAMTREFQAGLNYCVNRNVRFMADVVVPTDERDSPGATFLTRLQIVF